MKTSPASNFKSLHSTWKNVCVDFMTAYQDQKVNEMVALASKEATVSFVPLGEDGKGTIHGFGRDLWTSLIDCFPDLDNTVHSITAEENKVKCTVSIFGTQAKDFAGIRSQGLKFDSEHIFVFQLDTNQQIDHLEISWDHQDFCRQLGT